MQPDEGEERMGGTNFLNRVPALSVLLGQAAIIPKYRHVFKVSGLCALLWSLNEARRSDDKASRLNQMEKLIVDICKMVEVGRS